MRCRCRAHHWCSSAGSRSRSPSSIARKSRHRFTGMASSSRAIPTAFRDGAAAAARRFRRSRPAIRSRCAIRRRVPARSCITRTSTSARRSRRASMGRSSSSSRDEQYDPDRDRLLFFGTAGPMTNVIVGPFPNYVMNGEEHPARWIIRRRASDVSLPICSTSPTVGRWSCRCEWQGPCHVEGRRARWRRVASSQATMRPADWCSSPGEIYDFELVPAKSGTMALTFGPGGRQLPPGAVLPPRRTVSVRVR